MFSFRTLEKDIKSTTVIHMGDIFDSRKSIDLTKLLSGQRKLCSNHLKNIMSMRSVGNHDCYYKDTN